MLVDIFFLGCTVMAASSMYFDEEVQIHSGVVIGLDMLVKSSSILLIRKGVCVLKE